MATALIVYASLTGNTEEIADILAEALEERGVEVDMKECTSAQARGFNRKSLRSAWFRRYFLR